MYTTKISYTDFDGNKRSETHYFNLNEAELTELQYSEAGGFTGMIERLYESQDTSEIIRIFKKLITMSYGVKGPDGRRFIKNARATEEFMQTNAYSQFFMSLATDTNKAIEFLKGIMPVMTAEQQKEFDKQVNEKMAELGVNESAQ